MDEPLAFEKAMADMIALMHEGGIVKYRDALRVFKRHFLLNTLRMHEGNVSRAAEHLGVHRNRVHRHVRELGLRRRDRQAEGGTKCQIE